MRFKVLCGCVPRFAEFPDQDSAEACVRRHHLLTGHNPTIETILDTPFEGLLL